MSKQPELPTELYYVYLGPRIKKIYGDKANVSRYISSNRHRASLRSCVYVVVLDSKEPFPEWQDVTAEFEEQISKIYAVRRQRERSGKAGI